MFKVPFSIQWKSKHSNHHYSRAQLYSILFAYTLQLYYLHVFYTDIRLQKDTVCTLQSQSGQVGFYWFVDWNFIPFVAIGYIGF